MKNLFIATVIALFGASFAFAADAPDTVVIPSKMGNITLQHKTHGQKMSCGTCHGENVGKLLPMGKEKGHATCKDCHAKSGGPVGCKDCHKK